MRLVCKEYGLVLEYKENKVIELIIESSELFSTFTSRLINQSKGIDDFIIVSENDKELRFGKTVECITDPFNLDINNKRILSVVYQRMLDQAREFDQEQFLELQTVLETFISDACEKSEYPLLYDHTLGFVDLFRMYNVRINVEESDIPSRICSYIKLVHKVLGTGLIILVNIKAYLSEVDLKELYKTILYEKINVLVVERYDGFMSGYEDRIIIDKDFCIISN